MPEPSLNTGAIYAILGIFAAMLAGFYALARLMLGQATKDREADRTERQELSEAIKHMAGSTERVAQATIRGANEAKQRNGHLATLVVDSAKANQALAENATQTIITTIQKVQEQKVEHQIVNSSEIVNKEE